MEANALNKEIESIFDTTLIEAKFKEKLSSLKKKETELTELVNAIGKTSQTLEKEIERRHFEEKKLNDVIEQLETEKNELELKVSTHKENAERLRAEREKLYKLASKVADISSKLNSKIKSIAE